MQEPPIRPPMIGVQGGSVVRIVDELLAASAAARGAGSVHRDLGLIVLPSETSVRASCVPGVRDE